MTRILLATVFTFVTAGAHAGSWLSNDSSDKPMGYCKGFLAGGLASNQAASGSRTDLWLAWSYVIRSGAAGHDANSADYQLGRKNFAPALDAAAIQSMLDDADGSCGLGRSGHEVTGW